MPSRRSLPGSTSSTPFAASVEAELDANAGGLDAEALEAANARLIALKDALWAVRSDRLRTVVAVEALAGRDATRSHWPATSPCNRHSPVSTASRSAAATPRGVHVLVWGHDIDAPHSAAVDRRARRRPVVPVRGGRRRRRLPVVRLQGRGRDRRTRRQHRGAAPSLVADDVAAPALEAPDARVAILGHTRWASVGIISEPNTHPLNSWELEQPGGAHPRTSSPRSTATSTTTPT
jgi:glutamine---fructose-6-phosphate transaminase (isomerizing)